VRNLIEETADILERVGSNPPHRNGASILYGKYLRELVRQTPILPKPERTPLNALPPPPPYAAVPNPSMPFAPGDHPQSQPQYQPVPFWPEPLQFSAMSDNEIIETVLRAGAGNGFDTNVPEIPFDDTSGLVWSDWMNAPEFGFS